MFLTLIRKLTTVWNWPISPVDGSLNAHFSSFCRLKHITFYSSTLHVSPQVIESFSTFQSNLSSITLSRCTVSESALVHLINSPKLECLFLNGGLYRLGLPEQPHPSFSLRRPLEKLFVKMDTAPGDLPWFIEWLSGLGLHFDEVAFEPAFLSPLLMPSFNRIIQAVGADAKCLRLPQISSYMYNLLHPCRRVLTNSPLTDRGDSMVRLECAKLCESLSYLCRELHTLQLEISEHSRKDSDLGFISSIASPKIKKIILICRTASDRPVLGTFWTELDDVLIGIVGKRPGPNLGLEVVPQGCWDVGSKDFDQKGRLSKFIEEGKVTVLEY